MKRLDVDVVIAARYRWRSVRETLSFAGSQTITHLLPKTLHRVAHAKKKPR
jgi:hypothetical protein